MDKLRFNGCAFMKFGTNQPCVQTHQNEIYHFIPRKYDMKVIRMIIFGSLQAVNIVIMTKIYFTLIRVNILQIERFYN